MSMTTKIRLSPLICPRCLKTSAHASTRCVRGQWPAPYYADRNAPVCVVPHVSCRMICPPPKPVVYQEVRRRMPTVLACSLVVVLPSLRYATRIGWPHSIAGRVLVSCLLILIRVAGSPLRFYVAASRDLPPGSTYGGGSMMTYLIPDLPSWPKVSRSTGTRKSCRACKRTQRRRCSDY